MKKTSLLYYLRGLLLALLMFGQVYAASSTNAAQYARLDPKISLGEAAQVLAFIDEMVVKHGFDKATLTRTFSEVRYSEGSIGPFTPQMGDANQKASAKLKDWREYRARFVTPRWIDAGVTFWNQHASALARAEAEYGVAAEIIVGIIGVETRYGRNTGRYRVLDALATLAFDYPETPNRVERMVFFHDQLEQALLYAREAGLDPLSLLGSYAGAVGWPQFMPGSIRSYAVDFDKNGQVDLIHSPRDAIGSVANYLASHGWMRGCPIVFPAQLGNVSAQRREALIEVGLQARFLLGDLQGIGVTLKGAAPTNIRYGLVDLEHGFEPTQYWLATNNFFAITQYNRSYFYAMAVVDLGREVRKKRGSAWDEGDG